MNTIPWITSLSQGVMRASLLGGAAVLAVLLLRRALRGRLSPGVRCLLWLPVCVLLLSPRLPYLGFSMARTPPVSMPPAAVEQEPQVIARAGGTDSPALDAAPRPAAPVLRLEQKLALAWAGGAALLMLAWAGGYRLLRRRVARQAVPVPEAVARLFAECCRAMEVRRTPRIEVSHAVPSPALAGVLRPVLLLPPGLEASVSPGELRMVLLHEAGHVRRRDLPLHWLSLLVLALHWFNPLCWLAAWLFRADRESACDAAVLRACREDSRSLYGHTLLKLQAGLARGFGFRPQAGLLGSTDLLRWRILEIARFGRGSRLAGLLAMFATFTAAAGMALIAGEPAKAPPAPAAAADVLVTRAFKAPPDFLNAAGGRKQTARQKLSAQGVPFPLGASAAFVPATSQLIVRNTQANLQLVAKIVGGLAKGAPHVHISSLLVVFKEGAGLNALPFSLQNGSSAVPGFALQAVYKDAEFEVVMRGLNQSNKVKTMVPLPSIILRSGIKGRTEAVRGLTYGTDFDKLGKAIATENTAIGVAMNVEPVVGYDGWTIDLNLEPEIAGLLKWNSYKTQGADIRQPEFGRQKLNASVALPAGSTAALAGKAAIPAFMLDPAAKGEDALLAKEYQVILFATAQLVAPAPPLPGNKAGPPVKVTLVTCDLVSDKEAGDDPFQWLSSVLESAKTAAAATGPVGLRPVAASSLPPQIMTLAGVYNAGQMEKLLASARTRPGVTMGVPATQFTGAGRPKAAFDLGTLMPRSQVTAEAAVGPDGQTIDLSLAISPANPGPGVTTSVTVWDKQTVVLGGIVGEDAKARHSVLLFVTPEMVEK